MYKKLLLILIISVLITACTVPEENLNGVKDEVGCGEASIYDGYLMVYDAYLDEEIKYNIMVCGGSGKVVFSKKNDSSGDFYHFVTSLETEPFEHYVYELKELGEEIILE